MREIKRKVQDSLFTGMFGDKSKKYLPELYQALHPEDREMTVDKLAIVSIENIFVNDLYNDLGFLADDKLIVLVEAQSTWSNNIPFRMFLYLARTYQDYLETNRSLKIKMYGQSPVILPSPELYVIYTGDDKHEKEVLTLKDDFFGGNDYGIDLKVNVISDDSREDIIGSYITFCKVFKIQLKLYPDDRRKAVFETIRICIENGDLNEYLEQHREEVEDYMYALMTQDEAYELYGDFKEEEGIQKGIQKGQIIGQIKLLYEMGYTTEDICKKLGIDMAEIEQLSIEFLQN